MISITRPLPLALLIGLTVGIAIGVAVTAIAGAQGPTVAADVRITARLLENGKVEFGLQQREGTGWGEIILPRVNKFPYATATVDRWLYSSPVPVAVAAPRASAHVGPPRPRGWLRIADGSIPHVQIVDWTLAGTGEYAADGRVGYDFPASPQLLLRCLTYSDGNQALAARFTAESGHPYPGSAAGTHTLSARVAGGETNWIRALGGASIFPSYAPWSDLAFLDWLAMNYVRNAHNPILTLAAHDADGRLYFEGTFDLTGLPAVLADLPCYE